MKMNIVSMFKVNSYSIIIIIQIAHMKQLMILFLFMREKPNQLNIRLNIVEILVMKKYAVLQLLNQTALI